VHHWLPFISEKFQTTGKKIGDQEIEQICEITEGHPFYTQHLCHAVWERLAPNKRASSEDIKNGERVLLAREASAFSTLWESLTINQRRFLRGLALENRRVSPYSVAFLQKYGLSNPSSIQRISGALMKRDVIDRDGHSFVISDRFLRIWIREREE
jgi:hypothetical protein